MTKRLEDRKEEGGKIRRLRTLLQISPLATSKLVANDVDSSVAIELHLATQLAMPINGVVNDVDER
jgi:hypothetical protein